MVNEICAAMRTEKSGEAGKDEMSMCENVSMVSAEDSDTVCVAGKEIDGRVI